MCSHIVFSNHLIEYSKPVPLLHPRDVVKYPLHRVPLPVDYLGQIDVNEEGTHDVAVESVGESAVAWDAVREVFYLQATLQARGEEPTEWRD